LKKRATIKCGSLFVYILYLAALFRKLNPDYNPFFGCTEFKRNTL